MIYLLLPGHPETNVLPKSDLAARADDLHYDLLLANRFPARLRGGIGPLRAVKEMTL